MDHDAGVEVWTVPVFKANYMMEAVPMSLIRSWCGRWYSAEPTRPGE
jgi:hypothetical protein